MLRLSTTPTVGTFCYPSFHAKFAPQRSGPADQFILRSGCRVGTDGNIPCVPEALRASAEKQLQASGLWAADKPLDLATYTLARNIQSEVGNGTIEERIAVGESTVNRGKLGGLPPQDAVLAVALFRQPSRLYGQINVPGVKTGRFTSTSKDPSVLNTLLADLILSGKSGNFNLGADDQDGLEYQKYFPVPMRRVLEYARNGSYWVGPLPGVDHWKLALFRKLGLSADSPQGILLVERARQFFGNPVYAANGIVVQNLRPVWPADLPLCAASPSMPSNAPPRNEGLNTFVTIFAGVVGFVGLSWAAFYAAKRIAMRGTAP